MGGSSRLGSQRERLELESCPERTNDLQLRDQVA